MKYILIPLVFVAGCSTGLAPQRQAATDAGDACGASQYQDLIGADAVVELSLPEPKRSYRLGDPVTQDFVPERLNIVLDEIDTIAAIRCG